MANVINRTTKKYLESVNTPDYPVSEWIINPVLPDCDSSEWVIDGDLVRETTQSEKDAKVAERQTEQAARDAEGASKKVEAKVKEIKDREDFIALPIEDKLLYLYEMR